MPANSVLVAIIEHNLVGIIMIKNKALLSTCSLVVYTLFPQLTHGQDAQAIGRGFTGVSFTQASSASIYNPALLNHGSKKHGFDFILSNVAVSAYAQKDSIDAFDDFDNNDYFEDLSDALVRLDNLANASEDQFNQDKARLNSVTGIITERLEQLDEKPIAVDASGFASISFSNKNFGISLYTGLNSLKLEVLPDINGCDLEVLNSYTQFITDEIDIDNRIMPINEVGTISCEGSTKQFDITKDGKFTDPSDDKFADGSPLLNTKIQGLAVGIFETGLSLSHGFEIDDYHLSIGITPKIMQIQTLFISHSVKDIEDDLIDIEESYDNDLKKEKSFNMDLGFAFSMLNDHLTLGLAGKNIISKRYHTNLAVEKRKSPSGEIEETGNTFSHSFSLSPQWTTGISYTVSGLTIAADYDLTKREPFFAGFDHQFLSIGLEYNVFNVIALRVGGRLDTFGNISEQLTTGFTLGNRIFHMDLGAQYSEEMASVGFQMGFGF